MKKLSEEKKKIIDRLIPLAQREADAYIKRHGDKGKTWSAVYHEAMDRMAREEGVRV